MPWDHSVRRIVYFSVGSKFLLLLCFSIYGDTFTLIPSSIWQSIIMFWCFNLHTVWVHLYLYWCINHMIDCLNGSHRMKCNYGLYAAYRIQHLLWIILILRLYVLHVYAHCLEMKSAHSTSTVYFQSQWWAAIDADTIVSDGGQQLFSLGRCPTIQWHNSISTGNESESSLNQMWNERNTQICNSLKKFERSFSLHDEIQRFVCEMSSIIQSIINRIRWSQI